MPLKMALIAQYYYNSVYYKRKSDTKNEIKGICVETKSTCRIDGLPEAGNL